MTKKKIINPGDVFGKLRVMNEIIAFPPQKHRRFLVQCGCGNKTIVIMDNLLRGLTKSCGCGHGKHHKSNHPLYTMWKHIKQRCQNPSEKMYPYYGGRGIDICKEWQHSFQSFYDWSISNGYNKGLTIDRENNNGNYTPGNCRFVTMKVQQNNKRNNVFITINGTSKTIGEWSSISGIKYDTIWARIKRYGYNNCAL